MKRRVSVNSEMAVLMRSIIETRFFPQDASTLCVTVLCPFVSWDKDDDIMNSCGARVCVE